MTVILITHYMEEVIYADKVIVMDDGKIVMQGTPQRDFLLRWTHLKKYRLDVPQVTLLAHELRKAGLDLPDGYLKYGRIGGSIMSIEIKECKLYLQCGQCAYEKAGT